MQIITKTKLIQKPCIPANQGGLEEFLSDYQLGKLAKRVNGFLYSDLFNRRINILKN